MHFNKKNVEEWDLPNWLTLVTEVLVGIFIAGIVFRMTKKSERKNQEILDKIGPIIQKENELSKLREFILATNLTWKFLSIKMNLEELKNILDFPETKTLDESRSKTIKNDIIIMIEKIYSLDVTKLRNTILIEEILDYLHYLKRYCEHEIGSHWTPHNISELIQKNEDIKNQCKKISLTKNELDNEKN